jgi:RNA polymerase sigma-70 factor (ECF subfamily)
MTEKSQSFAIAFEEFRPHLKSYLLRMTASTEDAQDLVQDTFIKAERGLQSFEGKSTLKTWVFAIATNLAKNSLRSRKLWPENVTDIGKEAALSSPSFMKGIMEVHETSPQGAFEIREHINFCFTCIGKTLPMEQQVALLLKEIHDFKVSEIAEILKVTEGVAKHLLFDARQTMIRIFEKRCSLINKEGICHQCSELNGMFNGKHETQKELMKLDLVNEANSSAKEELLDLRVKIVKSIDPFHAAGSDLQFFHLKHTQGVMEALPGKT